MPWFDENGSTVKLGRQIKTGGEGTVFELANDPTKVAKIYHRTPDAVALSKLQALRNLANTELFKVAAWPTSLIFQGNDSQEVTGLVMPFVKGKEIHRLFGPHDRYNEFPSAAWNFLIHVAKNCAAAFDTLHEREIIMADVNEGNLLVGEKGFISLIDCDSYQIRNTTHQFLCNVGVPLWTPPELQGQSFRNLVRTKNHDRFGLALLIFKLLFMGRHPFAGVPDRSEQFEIEQAIRQFLFAFSCKARPQGLRLPPHVLPLNSLPENVANLFERAFLRGSELGQARPSAKDWYYALDYLFQNLRTCSYDPGHKYPGHLAKCPWCVISNDGGPNFFVTVTIYAQDADAGGQAGTDLVAVYWKTIQQTGPVAFTTKRSTDFPTPVVKGSPIPAGVSKYRPGYVWGWLILLGSIGLLFGGFWLAVIGIFVGWGMLSGGSRNTAYDAERKRRISQRELASRELAKADEGIHRTVKAYQTQFAQKKAELQGSHNRYVGLSRERQQEMQRLESKKRQLQLNEFLDKKLIRQHRISGIGVQRSSVLQAYGIETALDVKPDMQVPGFGPHLISMLLAWRSRWESQFHFNSQAALPVNEVAALNLRMSELKRRLEVEIRSGPQILNGLAITTRREISEIEAKLPELVRRNAQAIADANATR